MICQPRVDGGPLGDLVSALHVSVQAAVIRIGPRPPFEFVGSFVQVCTPRQRVQHFGALAKFVVKDAALQIRVMFKN